MRKNVTIERLLYPPVFSLSSSASLPLLFSSSSAPRLLLFRSSVNSRFTSFCYFYWFYCHPHSTFNLIDFQIRQRLAIQNSFASFRFNRCDYSNQYLHERQLNRSKVYSVFFVPSAQLLPVSVFIWQNKLETIKPTANTIDEPCKR